jgi:pilus assembly protein FimV
MKRKKLPADRSMGTQIPMRRPHWRASALAIATAVLLSVSAMDASALGLGRVTVHSALGEPLSADIELPEVNAEELASLRATIASPDAYRAAGFDYNPAVANVTITLQRRPDGSHFLRLTSPRPVNDPFIDLILEANWSSGRIVRDYTMLFDPPNLRPSAPPVAAEVPRVSPAPSTAPAPRTAAESPVTEGKPAAEAGKQVVVKSGDTAGRIAAANKPSSVSLDQMLIAMLRGNPGAFVNGNVNRLRAGAVLDLPTAEQAEMVPSAQARQDVIAQARDFNEFRRRLAEALPAAGVVGSERRASGRVQALVEEKKPAGATPDKLTLSKGAVQGKGAADKIARDRAAQDDAMRLAELNKNISELSKLGTSTAAAPIVGDSAAKPGVALPLGTGGIANPPAAPGAPIATSAAAPAPAISAAPAANAASAPALAETSPSAETPVVAAPALATSVPAPDAVVPAQVSDSATAPAGAASALVATADPAAKPSPAPVPPPETSLVDDLLENPLLPVALGGVLALLLGFAFYRAQQRKKFAQVDSSFLESRLQPDSFFGASGGQRIDTNEANATGSSMVYSPSQLDAAGDVDPVAEADVYLAYGRDLQAEEILKEAMRTTPQRVAVHSKLLEIYAKRRDAKAFELIASEAYALTRGEGPEWDHICELGQELDPSNSLYRPGGRPAPSAGAAGGAIEGAGSLGAQTMPMAAPSEKPVDLDLDLDFSIGDDPAPVAADASVATQALASRVPEPMPSLDMEFGTATAAVKTAVPELPAASGSARMDAQNPNLSVKDLSFTQPVTPVAPPVAVAPALNAGMIEFDLGALSLDLDSAPSAATPGTSAPPRAPELIEVIDVRADASISTAGPEADSGDPLATKLALAEEFNAIGDPDGARSLAQEVLAEASGDLKRKAQRFLAEIA